MLLVQAHQQPIVLFQILPLPFVLWPMQRDPITLHYKDHSQERTLFTIPPFVAHQVCRINFHHL